MEKNEKKNWFVTLSQYHHQTMGLETSTKMSPFLGVKTFLVEKTGVNLVGFQSGLPRSL